MAGHTFAGEASFLHFVVLHAEFVLGESQGAARSPLRGDPGGLWPPSAALRAAGAAPLLPRKPAKRGPPPASADPCKPQALARRAGAAQRRRRGAACGRPKNRPKGGLPCGPLPVPAQMCEGDCRKTDRPCGVRPFPPAWPRCGGGGCTWRCARCGRGHRF